MTQTNKTQQDVKEYYGQMLQNTNDLKTDACCDLDTMPEHVKPLIKNIHPEILDKFYGCGSPIPHDLEGKTVLDLGCGTGRDSYILSQLVGENGRVIGIDMTDEQLSVAKRHLDYQMDKFGYQKPNVEFHKGFIEDLKSIGIEDDLIDFVTSNCVINLSDNKDKVFSEIFRVLKPSGELFFSDIFADRRIPQQLAEDKIILGECLGGALYIQDFRRILRNVGCLDYRVVSSRPLAVNDKKIIKEAGMIGFYSMTIRTFKSDFEDICENYGHVAFYNGTIENSPHSFILDNHHEFFTNLPVPICGNTAKMLGATRYAKHFNIIGDFSTHYGEFDCSNSLAPTDTGACC